jgi:hypothetical protein
MMGRWRVMAFGSQCTAQQWRPKHIAEKSVNEIRHKHLSAFCWLFIYHSFIPLPRAQCDDSLPFSAASSIPLCYIPFPANHLHQLFSHPPLLHFIIYFLVYLLVLLIPNSCTILFWEFYFLPFSVHVQTNVVYVALFSLLW